MFITLTDLLQALEDGTLVLARFPYPPVAVIATVDPSTSVKTSLSFKALTLEQTVELAKSPLVVQVLNL